MSKTLIIISAFVLFLVVTFALTIYEMRHAQEVVPNDETFLD